jgi:predicted nucleic acid-binding protein
MSAIVCDIGPIIHLYEAGCLHLLKQTGEIFLPHRVRLEVQTAIHLDKQWPEWLNVVKLSLKEQTEAGAWQASRRLHAGEAEAIVLSEQKNAEWLLTDDPATRLFVSVLGIEVRGSLGVVLWNAAKRHINREETEEALDGLRQSSLWLSENIYREARQALDSIFKSCE